MTAKYSIKGAMKLAIDACASQTELQSNGLERYLTAMLEEARQEERKRFKDFPENDAGEPIVYDTNEVDEVTHALTGDEGEDDSVTVLKRLAAYVESVWPGKTAQQVMIDAEEGG